MTKIKTTPKQNNTQTQKIKKKITKQRKTKTKA